MKKTTNISLVLITHNEEENLNKNFNWLDECKTINEVIVIDDKSTDKTIRIAQKLKSKDRKVKIFSRELNQDFSTQKNFAISKTTNDLILSLDADEYPNESLILFLNHIDKIQYENYSFKRQDTFLGHILKHGETASLYFTRLFNKKHGKFVGKVHEFWQTKKYIEESELIIYHNSHQTLKSFMEKIDFYSTIRSQELFDQKKHSNIFQIIFFPLGKFIQSYIFQLGFLDGTPGIIMALCLSFHVFLNKSKLWHLYQQ